MAVYKGFRFYISSDKDDPLNTILADFGNIVISILQSTGVGTSAEYMDLPNDNRLSTYTTEASRNMFGAILADGANVLVPTTASDFFAVMKETRYISMAAAPNGYIILYNSNGGYFHSGTAIEFQSQTTYSADGALLFKEAVGSTSALTDVRYSFTKDAQTHKSCRMSFGPFIGTYDGELVTGIRYYMSGYTGNSRSQYPARIELKLPSERSATINALNACSQYVYDPYSEIPPSGPGGGGGTGPSPSSDPIDFNSLPEVSAVGTGFISLWSPTEQQMLDLSAYMWNANILDIDFWRKLIADPMQLIYGLNIIPLDLDALGLIGGTDSVVVGMINTGISMNYLTKQWVELDCGTIDIDEAWKAYLDYDPYTKIDIYLPYIGYRSLRVDDFMPGTIHVKYKIDLLTGSCVAQIKATKFGIHDDQLASIVYQFMGNCATQIPVTASQYADAVRSAISMAAAIGTVALLAGSGAPGAALAGGSEIMPIADPAGLLSGPGMVPVNSELYSSMSRYAAMTSVGAESSISSGINTLKSVGAIHAGASAVENVMGIKPSVERSGAIGGAAGMLATQTPYVVLTRPRQAKPENQSKYTGYPSFITRKLSELTGFTQVQAIHLEGLPCTSSELAEIDALLKGGVIF